MTGVPEEEMATDFIKRAINKSFMNWSTMKESPNRMLKLTARI